MFDAKSRQFRFRQYAGLSSQPDLASMVTPRQSATGASGRARVVEATKEHYLAWRDTMGRQRAGPGGLIQLANFVVGSIGLHQNDRWTLTI